MRYLASIIGLCILSTILLAQGIGGKSGIGGKAGIGGGAPAAAVNASYVSSSQCQATGANCTISSISIPANDIIAVAVTTTAGGSGNTFTVSDSNSDSASCGAAVNETTDNFPAQMCVFKAGATITTITCAQLLTSFTVTCMAAWYSPGTLLATLDSSAGQDQPNTAVWTSGNTATLTGTNDLVVGFWVLPFGAATSTYSDGGTQRITISATMSGALEDRSVSGTGAVAASGTWSTTAYGIGLVVAIK